MNRRYFIMSSAAATALQATRTVASPNDTVRVAVVGCGGRGSSHMGAWTTLPNVELAALVDVDTSHSERYIGTLQKRGKNPVPTAVDIRKILDDMRTEGGYSFIFDVSAGNFIVSVDKNLDLTERVISKMRLSAPKAAAKPPAGPATAPAGLSTKKPPTE